MDLSLSLERISDSDEEVQANHVASEEETVPVAKTRRRFKYHEVQRFDDVPNFRGWWTQNSEGWTSNSKYQRGLSGDDIEVYE
jgi:hypothetical protein